MRRGQLGKAALGARAALDAVVLRLDGGHCFGLVLAVLRARLRGQPGQRLLPGMGGIQAQLCLTHVLDVRGAVGTRFGGDEHAPVRARHAPGIGRQLPAVAARVHAAVGRVNAGDAAQRQLAVLVVALELGLECALGVVQHQMVAAAIAAAVQFAAAQSGQRALRRQMPGRHVVAVVDDADDDGVVDIPIEELHQHFLAHARQAHLAEVLAGHGQHDAYPR